MKHSPAWVVVALLAFACTGPPADTGRPASPAAPMTDWISVRDILFDVDTAEIRSSERSKISDIATYVNHNPSRRVGIDGSTDLLRSTNRYNVALSQQRIANVRDALIRAGVSADRIETGRFGADRVECDDSTEECSRREGRVEVMGRRS